MEGRGQDEGEEVGGGGETDGLRGEMEESAKKVLPARLVFYFLKKHLQHIIGAFLKKNRRFFMKTGTYFL